MRFHTDIQQTCAGTNTQTHKAWWVYFPWTYGGKYKEIHKSNHTQKTWHAVLPDLCDADAQNYSCTSTKDRSKGWQHFPPVCLRQFSRKKILTGVRISNAATAWRRLLLVSLKMHMDARQCELHQETAKTWLTPFFFNLLTDMVLYQEKQQESVQGIVRQSCTACSCRVHAGQLRLFISAMQKPKCYISYPSKDLNTFEQEPGT